MKLDEVCFFLSLNARLADCIVRRTQYSLCFQSASYQSVIHTILVCRMEK